MIGRADIEGSKSSVAMSGLAATSQLSLWFNPWFHHFYQFVGYPPPPVPTTGHLRYLLTDVPPQPNSPPDNVLRLDRPAEASLRSKRRGCYPASDSRILSWLFDAWGKLPKEPFPACPLADTRRSALTTLATQAALQQSTVRTGTPSPALVSQSFSGYGSILPTFLAYIVPSTRGCSPWRHDAVISTTGRERHSVLRIFKGHRECTGHHATCGALPAAGPYLRLSRFQWAGC
ncbi:hypothetical protein Bca52824_073126 [Brassica carinata]|uniref:Uncharacterized protein n=1 Tax=Brassica carinata TaxID=52824 RepID=A0A8X7Q9P4_BRACI|nr:hypothetical protein Bca52824_073126 [Brassica carinata]